MSVVVFSHSEVSDVTESKDLKAVLPYVNDATRSKTKRQDFTTFST